MTIEEKKGGRKGGRKEGAKRKERRKANSQRKTECSVKKQIEMYNQSSIPGSEARGPLQNEAIFQVFGEIKE